MGSRFEDPRLDHIYHEMSRRCGEGEVESILNHGAINRPPGVHGHDPEGAVLGELAVRAADEVW